MAQQVAQRLLSQLGSNVRGEPEEPHPRPRNPFAYPSNPVPAWEAVKLVLGGIVLIPLKLIALIFLTLVAVCFSHLAVACGFDESKPMSRARRMWLIPVAYAVRASLFLAGYYWVEVTGAPCDSKDARVVVAAPHSTCVDTLYLVFRYRVPSSLSKAENKSLPFFGAFFRAMQVIAVQRDSREAKDSALRALAEKLRNPDDDRHFMVFPEGTCHNRSSIITFKRGAFTPGLPVQPVALEWPHFFFDPTWSSAGPNRFIMALRLHCQLFNRLRVHFLPVYVPSDAEKADPELYARNVRAVIAAKLNLPVSAHSYHDMFLAKDARRRGVVAGRAFPQDMHALEVRHHVTLEQTKRTVRRYARALSRLARDDEGVTPVAVARCLHLPPSAVPAVRAWASGMTDANGLIDVATLAVASVRVKRVLGEDGWREAVGLVRDSCAGAAPEGGERSSGTITVRELLHDVKRRWPKAFESTDALAEFFDATAPELVHIALIVAAGYSGVSDAAVSAPRE